MQCFPVYLLLHDKKCLVIGGGRVAARKVEQLLDYAGGITVISPQLEEKLERLWEDKKIDWVRREYKSSDIKGYSLVIGATDSEVTNKMISADAQAEGILHNIVDVPELCSFYVPSIIRKGDLQIAVSTSGASPGFSRIMRKHLEKKLKDFDAAIVSKIGEFRKKLKQRYPDNMEKRMAAMNELVDKLDLDNIDHKLIDDEIKKVLQ